MTWRLDAALPPLGPALDQLEGAAFQLRAATYATFAQQGINLRALSYDSFFRRAGPLCWEHDAAQVVGRVFEIVCDAEGMLALLRFNKTPRARCIRQALDWGHTYRASLKVNALGHLTEISLTHNPVDPNTSLTWEDRVLLRVRKE